MSRASEAMPARRHARLLERVRQTGAASIQDLVDALGASAATVRRDLAQLEQEGLVVRTHGGAVLPSDERATFEPGPAVAERREAGAKRAIGAAAAALVQAGESVVLDSGTTVLAAARALVARDLALTAVTNDLTIAQVLAEAPRVRTVVTGGTLRPGSFTLTGAPGEAFLDGLQADIAFVGAHAVAEGSLRDTSLEIAATKRAVLRAARRVVLLVDATKFAASAFCRIAPLAAVQHVIVDSRLPSARLGELRKLGLQVTVVDAEP